MTAQDRGWGPGWPDCQHGRMVSLTVAGVTFPQGVHEDVEPVLRWVAEQFHERVEPLRDGWCWAFSCRDIGGSGVPSNHSWGIALDWNAPDHPQGQVGTFTTAQVREIRSICREAGCRWGGDFNTTIDEMHAEFMGTPADARRIAPKLGGGQANFTEGEDMLSSGDQGQAVTQWQQALRHYFWYQDVTALPDHGPDGDFGDETVEWTRKFQSEVGLPPGMVTPAEWHVMGLALYRRDDPVTVPVERGEPAKLDDRSLLDYAWLNRKAIGNLSGKLDQLLSRSPEVDEEALADALAPKLDVNRETIKSALREVLRRGVGG